MVIDLSGMNRVQVDAGKRVARAEASALVRDLDHATQRFGQATTSITRETARDTAPIATSVYNPSNGQWSHGGGNSIERDTEIQIGNLVYESSQIHKEVQVGKDYRVNIETDKHGSVKKLRHIVGEKTYSYNVTGAREAKSN